MIPGRPQRTKEAEMQLARVDGVPSDRPLGSTASSNELLPALYEAFREEVEEYLALRAAQKEVTVKLKFRIGLLVNFAEFFSSQGLASPVSVDAVDPVLAKRLGLTTREKRVFAFLSSEGRF